MLLGRRPDGSEHRRRSPAPIVTATGEEPHSVALAPDLKTVAVVLYRLDPVEPGGWLGGAAGISLGGTKPVARGIPLYYRRR
jgi:hypothetical protein